VIHVTGWAEVTGIGWDGIGARNSQRCNKEQDTKELENRGKKKRGIYIAAGPAYIVAGPAI
jgi:hypothetical protein